MSSPLGYSRSQILLHWSIAALIIFQLFVHDGMSDAFDDWIDGDGVEGGDMGLAILHIIVGVAVFALAVLRLTLRLTRGVPEPHRDKPAPIIWLADATHYALYGLMFFMPLTGALAWFGGSEDAGDLHEAGQALLIPLVLLHVGGALAEHFVFRNDSLVRIIRPDARR